MTKSNDRLRALSLPEQAASRRCRPIIRQQGDTLVLSFDSRTKQSAMSTRDPEKLTLSYTRYMMGFLLLQPEPREILIIGLGGGSLSKYCYRRLPQARITTVEISEKVIGLGSVFAIPADDERFRIVRADGADFIEGCQREFDAILLDGFDADGLPARLSSRRFYQRCAAALRNEGQNS